ncbi:zincin, partial [Terfezia boudieri ATCC MYA-4762]
MRCQLSTHPLIPRGQLHKMTRLSGIYSPQIWAQYSPKTKSHTARAGLFKNKHLTSPTGFSIYAQKSLAKAQRLVSKIISADNPEQLRRIVRDLDRLSDLLCRVIDMADFVRATHPKPEIVQAANDAYGIMYEYMNVLNTTDGLYLALKKAIQNKDVVASWSAEEHAVALILYRDFEKSGVMLDERTKRRFVDISNEIAQIGPLFVNGIAPKKSYLTFQSSQLMGMDPMIVRQLTRGGKVTLPTIGMAVNHALRTVEDEGIRKELYLACNTSSDEQIQLLDRLLTLRGELAKLVGHDSYASMALIDKMARSPKSVTTFLTSLASANRPLAQAELDTLSAIKHSQGNPNPLQPWDREFYASKLLHSVRSKRKSSDVLSEFFSLGTVMQGLSRLFQRLYGVRFVPRETIPGETWNDDVRRLDVICENEGHIAVVYCDLFEREGKNPNPAHFTVRCSRRIDPDELDLSEPSEFGPEDDGMASARNPHTGELYQLPTIALICNFTRPPSYNTSQPTLLTFREVTTLFHEMGHAVHSMLGRTALHNVAGTRCPTDFAELPSVLMEHFVKSPPVLQLFARHYESDTPLPISLLTQKLTTDSLLDATETHSQIILALLDQSLHSSHSFSHSFSSSSIFRNLEHKFDILPPPVEETSWQGYFTHLFGYGATYYSYLFDRAIAGRVWEVVFREDPVSREAGGRWR